MTATTDAVDSLRTALSQAGGLFQSHPDVGEWQTTRPGAFDAEISAFTNKAADPTFNRLGIRHYEAGETDANNYTYENDAWIVETLDSATPDDDCTSYPLEAECFGSREALLDRVAEILETVSAEREGQ